MALFFENLGLDFLTETEEDYQKFLRHIAQDAKTIPGYYGSLYLDKICGDAQFVLRTVMKKEEKKIEIIGVDTHAIGRSVWKVRLSDMNIQRQDADSLERRCVVTKEDGSGMAVVNLVKADVLPSFLADREITMQVVAFPLHIEYFENEDAYADTQKEWHDGKKLLLADGTIFPVGMLKNHDPEGEAFEENEYADDIVLVRGTVKSLYHGEFAWGEEKQNTFIRCIISTEFGDLDIAHTIDQVKEEQRKQIHVGAVVNCACVLSGDVAIYEYEEGIVRDEKNNLALMQYIFSGGDADRLRDVLSEDATYTAETRQQTFRGRDEIIERLKYVSDGGRNKYFAHMATICSVDEGEEKLPYDVGQRCIVLARGEEHKYESIAFIDLDEKGNIKKILTSTNARYHFKFDPKPKLPSVLDDVKIPESAIEPILTRARFHGFIDDTMTDEFVLANQGKIVLYENNVKRMLETMPTERKDLFPNLFGYLFAKAIEMEYSKNIKKSLFGKKHIVSYTPSDAWDNRITSTLKREENKKLEEAMRLGTQFYKDFIFVNGNKQDKETSDELVRALVLVQQIGELYAKKYMQ